MTERRRKGEKAPPRTNQGRRRRSVKRASFPSLPPACLVAATALHSGVGLGGGTHYYTAGRLSLNLDLDNAASVACTSLTRHRGALRSPNCGLHGLHGLHACAKDLQLVVSQRRESPGVDRQAATASGSIHSMVPFHTSTIIVLGLPHVELRRCTWHPRTLHAVDASNTSRAVQHHANNKKHEKGRRTHDHESR